MVLILDIYKRDFLGLGDDFEVHPMLWRFVSGSCWNTHDASPVTMQSRKLKLSWQVWMKSWHDVSLRCFWPSVRLCGTDFAQIFLFRKSSWRIWRIVSLLMFNSSDILRFNWRSHVTISRTFAIVSAFLEVEGRPLLGSSWRSSGPSVNRLNHSDTLQWLRLHHHRLFATCHKFLLAFYPV
jgi:hypothetical protein